MREPYGDHEDQFGELTLPEGASAADPAPVAVLLHGGFWVREYADLAPTRPLARDLADRGWAAWNVEYRRLGGGGGWPATATDVSTAVDHLRALRDRGVPLDLDRVVTAGHSAGGHLALLDGARDPSDAAVRVRALVALAPLTDVRTAHGRDAESARIVERFMGGTPAADPDAYARASPVERVPLGVPQLLVHGALDDAVPAAVIDAYVAAARDAGDAVTLERPERQGHFDLIEPGTEAWSTAVAWLHRHR
ncbi:alpha/beta hydrolase [Patulibacter brassicae]|jgi:acetyl esterase/lipase|uniref:Alpha/beta hydrolase n=1 Tax=Patulibacter brassicae TaxID=1705717 RepID=A0ABU4VQR4_9ACTN|nr:alpha/beta hydrolase [Patulibacter brassicae]MDX8153271.1 alpha/beta hydrolase [Patulibacter brassicae]